MKKTLLLALLALCAILITSSVNAAEFDSQKAYNWLASNSVEGSMENDITATSWAVLAFNNAGLRSKADESLDWIFSEQRTDYCFPKSACKVKDTVMALIAMNEMIREDNVTHIGEKLQQMMIASSLPGIWALEVSPMSGEPAGECTISWLAGEIEESKTITVNAGRFPSCSNSYFLNIDSCVKSNLLKNSPGIILTVDCLALEGAKTISLIYKNSNSYYILDSQETDNADVEVNNGCYSLGPGDVACRKEVSMYTAWVLRLIGSETNMDMYFAENYDGGSEIDNALLYLATKDARYLPVLKDLQKSDGSFDRNVMATALTILALEDDAVTYAEDISAAIEWLKTKQAADGSLGSVTETAAALYAAFSDEDVDEIIDDRNDTESTDGDLECGDGHCDWVAGEDEDTCPEDCVSDDPIVPTDDICRVDGYCEKDYGENKDNCPDDCICGDGVCDDIEESEGSCEQDCEITTPEAYCGDGLCEGEEDELNCPDDCGKQYQSGDDEGSGMGTWIIVLLVLIVIGGGGYYAFKKGLFTKSKKPVSPFARPGYSFKPRPPTTPSTLKAKPMKKPGFGMARKPAEKSDELKKSLEEARKLLKK